MELFGEALELPQEVQKAWLDGLQGEDATLRAECERLLQADAHAGTLDNALKDAVANALESVTDTFGADEQAWIGRTIGPYRLIRLIGRGGNGVVFAGERIEGGFDQTVAIKLTLDSVLDPYSRTRFLQERNILARLQHPGIARLYDGGLDAVGRPWFAMEFVEGQPVTTACVDGSKDTRACVSLMIRVCDAVAYAHNQLVAHLDLKPGNILVRADGQPLLLDFGIARMLGTDTAENAGPQPLTPEYAAPEQHHGQPGTAASDIYSLGAILFELLTGQRPRTGNGETIASYDPPRHHAAALNGDLGLIVRKAMASDPGQRYRSAGALAADLQRVLEHRPISLRRGRAYVAVLFARRNRIGVALGAFAVISLLAISAIASWQAHVALREERISSATRDFMVNVFAEADPSHVSDSHLTAHNLLDAAYAQMDSHLAAGSNSVRFALLYALARSYDGIGAYARADQLAKEAQRLATQIYGVQSPQAGWIDLQLARQRDDQDRSGDAVPLAQAALARLRVDDYAHRAEAELILARSDFYLHKPTDEERHLDNMRAYAGHLADAARASAEGDAAYEQAMMDLGQGKLEQADAELDFAVKSLTHGRGPHAMQTLAALDMRGVMLIHTGHAGQAVDVLHRLLRARRDVYGPTHPVMADSYEIYGLALAYDGQMRKAADAMGSMLAVTAANKGNSTGGEYDLQAALVARMRGHLTQSINLADQSLLAYAALGKNDDHSMDVARFERRALDGLRGDPSAAADLMRILGTWKASGHYVLFSHRVRIADALMASGQAQAALNYEKRIQPLAKLPDLREALLLDQAETEFSLRNYAQAASQAAAAQRYFEGRDARDQHTAQLVFSWSELRLGKLQQARTGIEAALRWRQQELGENSLLTAEAHLAHAEMEAMDGRHDLARHENRLAHVVLASMLLPSSPLLYRTSRDTYTNAVLAL
jgi:serine/threonine-protein kinase